MEEKIKEKGKLNTCQQGKIGRALDSLHLKISLATAQIETDMELVWKKRKHAHTPLSV